jgi:hypothetical protein
MILPEPEDFHHGLCRDPDWSRDCTHER